MLLQGIPDWISNLDEEDLAFIKRFILSSGSLKEIAGEYAVSYPTVRLRLDRLIQKIKLSEEAAGEPYIALIKRLAIGEKIEVDAARQLIAEYRRLKQEESL